MKPFHVAVIFLRQPASPMQTDRWMGCWHDSSLSLLPGAYLRWWFDLERLKDAIDCKRQGFYGYNECCELPDESRSQSPATSVWSHNILMKVFKRVKLGLLSDDGTGVPLIWCWVKSSVSTNPKTQDSVKIEWMPRTLIVVYLNTLPVLICVKVIMRLHRTSFDFFHENPEAKVLLTPVGWWRLSRSCRSEFLRELSVEYIPISRKLEVAWVDRQISNVESDGIKQSI